MLPPGPPHRLASATAPCPAKAQPRASASSNANWPPSSGTSANNSDTDRPAQSPATGAAAPIRRSVSRNRASHCHTSPAAEALLSGGVHSGAGTACQLRNSIATPAGDGMKRAAAVMLCRASAARIWRSSVWPSRSANPASRASCGTISGPSITPPPLC